MRKAKGEGRKAKGAKEAGDTRLRKVSEICLALPEASMERSGSHATFRVRKKVFAYFLDNHHGDGIVSVCAKTHLGENHDLAKHDPERFYLPAYIGPRGWVGLRLDRGAVRWGEVADLVRSSYFSVAPKKLAALARQPPKLGKPRLGRP